jgi:hypothetical protein
MHLYHNSHTIFHCFVVEEEYQNFFLRRLSYRLIVEEEYRSDIVSMIATMMIRFT